MELFIFQLWHWISTFCVYLFKCYFVLLSVLVDVCVCVFACVCLQKLSYKQVFWKLFKWKEQIEFPPVEGRGPLELMSSGKSFCCKCLRCVGALWICFWSSWFIYVCKWGTAPQFLNEAPLIGCFLGLPIQLSSWIVTCSNFFCWFHHFDSCRWSNIYFLIFFHSFECRVCLSLVTKSSFMNMLQKLGLITIFMKFL